MAGEARKPGRPARCGAVRLAVAAVAFSAACASGSPPQAPRSVPAPSPAAELSALQPGDAVRVEIWREPDLSGSFVVDERGVTVFPLLGEQAVAGLPVDSLRTHLVAEYRRYLNNPSISVTLLRRITILGEVRQPGLYPVDPTVTLAEALAMAGGIAPTGDAGEIRLVRNGSVMQRNLDRASVLGSTPVRSGDQIIVAERGWVSRNLALVTSALAAATSVGVALILR